MTKEEALKFLNGYMAGKIDPESAGFYPAVEFVVDILESQPSLPSNLDDAARSIRDELYLKEGKRDHYGNPYFLPNALMQAVFAGAEWMAGQFVLVGGEPTGWFRANDGSEYATGLDLEEPIKLPVDFYVRKK